MRNLRRSRPPEAKPLQHQTLEPLEFLPDLGRTLRVDRRPGLVGLGNAEHVGDLGRFGRQRRNADRIAGKLPLHVPPIPLGRLLLPLGDIPELSGNRCRRAQSLLPLGLLGRRGPEPHPAPQLAGKARIRGQPLAGPPVAVRRDQARDRLAGLNGIGIGVPKPALARGMDGGR